MTNQAISSTPGKAQLDDFFTASIVGSPQEVVLGQPFKERDLISQQYVTVNAINAKAWLSEPAYQSLYHAIEQSKRSIGVHYKKNFYKPSALSTTNVVLVFLAGFMASTLLGLALTYAWSRQWIQFTLFS